MTLDISLRTRLSRYTPVDLLDKLPDTDAVTEVMRRLSGLQKSISSFLPLYIADDEALLTGDQGFLRPGTFLFADVSGFTALSERLQQHGGSEGAETLTIVINDYFSTMLEILAKSDGQLLKFAGDALLAFFPANNDEVTKAIRTGLRMQRAMAKFQPIQTPELKQLLGDHDQQLSMSIGISRGKLFEALIGNSAQRDHIIQGSLPGMAMNAEGAGERDDVIIDEAVYAVASEQFETVALGGGFYRVVDNLGDNLDDYEFRIPNRRRAKSTAILELDNDRLLDDLRIQLERVEKVGRFMAPAVLNELIANGGDQLQSQNRLVVTMFMYVSGFATMLERWGEEKLPLIITILDRYYSIVQRAIAAHGGNITRTDPYQFGFKMLVTFGAPVANADDPQRAVSAALEIHRQVALFNARLQEELPPEMHCAPTFVAQRMGITMGPVFAGEVGWRARREYTVMGDDVNLSARLMGKAEMGQTLISQRVWSRIREQFDTEAIAPMQLKGKTLPIQAFLVKGIATHAVGFPSTSQTPFVGRETLMQEAQSWLNSVKTSRSPQVLALQAEAGLGKTRFAKELAQYAERNDFRIAWATCALKSERKTTWATLISQLLHIDRDSANSNARKLLKEELAKLGLTGLEGVFTDLLFDVVLPVEHPTPRQQTDSEKPAGTVDLFNLAARIGSTEEKRSGVFGRARAHVQRDEQANVKSSSALWQQAEMRTSLDEAVAQFLCAFTQKYPTLLVIDDLHRENPQALTILRRVLANTGMMRLALLLAYEPVELDLDLQPVTLTELTENDTYLMAVRYLQVDEIDYRLCELVWKRTNGRPLFIESLLQTLVDDQQIDMTKERATLKPEANIDALPDDIRKLIISRIDRLSSHAQHALRAASVLGEEFTVDALAAVSDVHETNELNAALRELVHAQVIEEGLENTYHFRHGLTRVAMYETLPRILRQKLHRLAAEYLTKHTDWERSLIQVAHHWMNGGMPMRGIQIVNDAAENAEASGSIERAIELYLNALEIFPSEKSWQTQLERLREHSNRVT